MKLLDVKGGESTGPPAGPVCGNNIQEGTETCDGTDLAGEDCISQGFTSGTLDCLGDCSGFDTSGCSMAACTPNDCAGLGYECGSGYVNGTCAGTLDCGTCGVGTCVGGTCVVAGNVYYVDGANSSCSDANTGTESLPWCTIQKAANTLIAGETVYIKTANYNERVTVANSGTAGNYISFKAYPGHNPHIIGDGTCNWNGVFNIASKDYIKLEDLELSRQDCYLSGAGYIIYIATGTYIELTNLDVHNAGYDSEHIQVLGASRYVKINNNTVYNGQCISGIDVYTKPGGAGSESGRPQNIEIAYNNVYDINPTYSACGSGPGISVERVDYATIYSNTITNSRIGIDAGCGKNDTIYNNIITNCQTGIAISGNEDSEIFDNIISGASDEGFLSYDHEDHPSEVHARNKWYRNIVYNSYIPFQEYHKPSQGPAAESIDHEVYNNLFYNNDKPVRFLDTQRFKFYYNTIYTNAGADGLEVADTSIDAIIKNNIISISGASYDPINIDASSSPGADIDYNLYEDRAGTASGPGANSIVADPEFITAGSDFHLQATSPARDSGVDVGITNDLDENSRPQGVDYDMGAYEYF
jgi:hypothetical protein